MRGILLNEEPTVMVDLNVKEISMPPDNPQGSDNNGKHTAPFRSWLG